MKTDGYHSVPTQFGPDIEFELTPIPHAQARNAMSLRFQELQRRLVQQILQGTGNPTLRNHLQQAANEAAALAWTTAYPLLVMPTLLEEKAHAARYRTERQNRIEMRSQEIAETMR